MPGASFTPARLPAAPRAPSFAAKPPKSSFTPIRTQPKGTVGAEFTTPAQTLHPSPASTPVKVAAAVAGTSLAPQAASAPPAAPAPSPAPVSPLDSTYFDNIAANQLKVSNQINTLNANSANLGTSLQAALAQLAYQQPRDRLKLEQTANKNGALYSSVYDQNLGNLNNTYLTKQTADTSTEGQKVAAINAQIAALNQGVPVYNAQQYDLAVARASKAAAANPATGQLPAAPAAAPAATSSAPAAPTVPAASPPPARVIPTGPPTPEKRSSHPAAKPKTSKKKGPVGARMMFGR